jgi:hypothetical protein
MTHPLSALSLDRLKRAVELREQIAALENELAGILGGEVSIPAIPAVVPPRRGRPPGKQADVVAAAPFTAPVPVGKGRGGPGTRSAEARARMAAGQKARWAKFHAAKGKAQPETKDGGMSRAERGRLGAKARWAKVRKEKGMNG